MYLTQLMNIRVKQKFLILLPFPYNPNLKFESTNEIKILSFIFF